MLQGLFKGQQNCVAKASLRAFILAFHFVLIKRTECCVRGPYFHATACIGGLRACLWPRKARWNIRALERIRLYSCRSKVHAVLLCVFFLQGSATPICATMPPTVALARSLNSSVGVRFVREPRALARTTNLRAPDHTLPDKSTFDATRDNTIS